MKITASQYAQALFEISQEKKEKDLDKAIVGFWRQLLVNQDSRLLESILAKFEEIWNKENGIIRVKIFSREKIKETLKEKIRKFIKRNYEAKEVILENYLNPSLKGGIILKIGDEVIDGSLKQKIRRLQKILTK